MKTRIKILNQGRSVYVTEPMFKIMKMIDEGQKFLPLTRTFKGLYRPKQTPPLPKDDFPIVLNSNYITGMTEGEYNQEDID